LLLQCCPVLLLLLHLQAGRHTITCQGYLSARSFRGHWLVMVVTLGPQTA
jgi:hypothetical protein